MASIRMTIIHPCRIILEKLYTGENPFEEGESVPTTNEEPPKGSTHRFEDTVTARHVHPSLRTKL